MTSLSVMMSLQLAGVTKGLTLSVGSMMLPQPGGLAQNSPSFVQPAGEFCAVSAIVSFLTCTCCLGAFWKPGLVLGVVVSKSEISLLAATSVDSLSTLLFSAWGTYPT